jgi:magnesium chelatase family protein
LAQVSHLAAVHVDVPAVSPADLALPPPREAAGRWPPASPRRGRSRPGANAGLAIRSNAEADGQFLDEVATPDAEGRKPLAAAAERFKLSVRGYHRVLRMARTLADLEASAGVRRLHVAEALSYRRIAPARG